MKKLFVYATANSSDCWVRSTTEEEVKKYFQIQINSSLKYGWSPEDILLITNFDWKYQGIKTITPDIFQNYSGSCHAKYKALEWALNKFQENIWLNDYDNFQIKEFSLDPINKILKEYWIYGCGKPNKKRWSDLSMFFSLKCSEVIKNFFRDNPYLNKRKGITFRMCRYFLKNHLENVLLQNNLLFPYRFNTVGGWRKTIRKMNQNNISPYTIHGKIDSQHFQEALNYLRVNI